MHDDPVEKEIKDNTRSIKTMLLLLILLGQNRLRFVAQPLRPQRGSPTCFASCSGIKISCAPLRLLSREMQPRGGGGKDI